MNTANHDAQTYWNQRWQNAQTAWDMGCASAPLTAYLEQCTDKHSKVLIPGCGNAYEAQFMVSSGFTDITLVDIAPTAVENLRAAFQGMPAISIHCEDFFAHEGAYDLILEQTFFCAIPVERRPDYAQKMASLLRRGGRLAGVLFNRDFGQPHPPFGGSAAEYRELFAPYFQIKTMETCYNSVAPRAQNELFILLVKK